MSDPRQDLRATEESIREDAQRVDALEAKKAALDPADPHVLQLSEQVEQLATALRAKATAERELSEEILASE